jgi:hypothetical protein
MLRQSGQKTARVRLARSPSSDDWHWISTESLVVAGFNATDGSTAASSAGLLDESTLPADLYRPRAHSPVCQKAGRQTIAGAASILANTWLKN